MRSCVRALSVRLAGGASSAWLLTLLVLSLLSGCQKPDEISRDTVKKMPSVERRAKAAPAPGPAMRPSGHGNLGGERMLGAIALQGRTLWVFKVAGPKDVVADQMPNFLTLIRSLKSGNEEDSPLEWTLPEGWTERKDSDPRSGRFTTLLVKTDGEELPLVVTRLPIPKERPISGLPLMVVNMWCEQLGLPEKTAADLKAEDQPKDAEVQQLEVSGTKVTLVNFLAPERSAPARPAPVVAKGLPQWKVNRQPNEPMDTWPSRSHQRNFQSSRNDSEAWV